VQAPLYGSVVAEAYQAGSAKVQVTDLRAAVERHNGERLSRRAGGGADQGDELRDGRRGTGVPLRVQMAPDAGVYKIARLDQVGSS